MKLSKHFSLDEFKCKCGSCETPTINPLLISELELIRSIVNEPIYINSGYRCKEHNKRVGGTNNSQHTLGNAADIRCKGINAIELGDIIQCMYPTQYGIGIYVEDNFVHFDVRDQKARWVYD